MDFGDVTGFLALLLSVVTLLIGLRSDNKSKKLIKKLDEVYQQESDRVDKLIEHLMHRGEGPT